MMTELSGLCSRLFDAALTSCYPGILMSLSTRQLDPPTTKFPDARYCTLLGFWFLLSALNTKFTSEIMKLFISWSKFTTQTTKIRKYRGHFTKCCGYTRNLWNRSKCKTCSDYINKNTELMHPILDIVSNNFFNILDNFW